MNNLSLLMAERNLKATRIATDTGIARSTLSSITNNSSKMIQLETVNTLCQYLEISPTDFFSFLPFDLSFNIDTEELQTSTDLNILSNGFNKISFNHAELDCFLKKSTTSNSTGTQEFTYDLTARLQSSPLIDADLPFETETLSCELLLGHSTDNEYYKTVKNSFESLWNKQLSLGFKTEIKKVITHSIKKAVSDSIVHELEKHYTKNPDNEPPFVREAISLIQRVDFRVKFSFNDAYDQPQKNNQGIFIEFNEDDDLPDIFSN